jgi:fatty acid-binding protein DegV
MPAIAVVTDADSCVPRQLLDDLDILTAPADPPLLTEAEAADVLRRDQAPAPRDAAVAACRRAAAAAETVIYVGCDDGYGGGPQQVEAARAALAADGRGAALVAVPIASTLMAAGWAAVAAAAAAKAGRGVGEVIAEAQRVGEAARVLALLEHPQLAGIGGGLIGTLRRARALIEPHGHELTVVERPGARGEGLVALRERFREQATAAEGYLRVAVLHAGAEPAALAMRRWLERELEPEEVVIAPLTRHAATRLGPGLVGFGWYRDEVR